jgi:membrane protease YdiL (CAAX protease family)
MLILSAARLLEIAILLALASAGTGRGLAPFGLLPAQWLAGLKKGVVWSLGFGLACAAVFAGFFLGGLNPLDFLRTETPSKPLEVLLFFTAGALISPIAEELFFRGLIYGLLRKWGVWTAVVVSTLLFVAAHASSNNLPVAQAVGGILFAVAYEKEKSLVVPITIHMAGNLALFSLAILSQ